MIPPHLMFLREPKLPDIPTPSILAPIEEHGPSTSERVGRTTSIRVNPLTGTASLLIRVTPPRRGNPKSIQFIDNRVIDIIGKVWRDPFPNYATDHDPSRWTFVTLSMFHEEEKLLLVAPTSNYLQEVVTHLRFKHY